MDEKMTLAIVVPCYNEEAVLGETTRQLSEVLDALETEKHIAQGRIIYVDDGSSDATWNIVKQLSEYYIRIMVVKLAHNVVLLFSFCFFFFFVFLFFFDIFNYFKYYGVH